MGSTDPVVANILIALPLFELARLLVRLDHDFPSLRGTFGFFARQIFYQSAITKLPPLYRLPVKTGISHRGLQQMQMQANRRVSTSVMPHCSICTDRRR